MNDIICEKPRSDTCDDNNARIIAIGSGDLWLAVQKETEKLLKENKGNPSKAVKNAVEQLFERKLITSQEVQDIKLVCDLVFRAIRGKENAFEAFKTIEKVHQRLIASPHSTPVALSIVSVAKSVFIIKDNDNSLERNTLQAQVIITPETTGAGAVTGAVIGGVVGGIVGGGLGAVIGSAVGAAAGAAIGFCNQQNT